MISLYINMIFEVKVWIQIFTAIDGYKIYGNQWKIESQVNLWMKAMIYQISLEYII